MRLHYILAISLLFLTFGSVDTAHAEEQFAAKNNTGSITRLAANESSNAGVAAASTIGMVTGSPTGTYYRFGQDIKESLAGKGFDVSVKESTGSIDNIHRIGSSENAALGIVQSDVLGFLMGSEQQQSKKLANNLRMIFPFYSEEVHVLAHKSIRDFSDLNGKVVVVGPKGSGSWLTSVNLFNIADVRPARMLRISAEEGVVSVLSGKADAMIYVGCKPVKLFDNLSSLTGHETYADMLDNVHLVPLKDPAMLKEYASSVITSRDYAFVEKEIPTLSVTAVLVSYDFSDLNTSYAQSRCDDIRNFSGAISEQVGNLQRAGHPKWQEVNLNAEVGFWKRDRCAASGTTATVLEDELLNTLMAQ